MKELVGAVPVTAVDAITIRRLAIGKTITLTISGVPIVLESGAMADAKGRVEAFERAMSPIDGGLRFVSRLR